MGDMGDKQKKDGLRNGGPGDSERDDSEREMTEAVKKFALQNAVLYGGRASVGSVMGKVMAERPEWKPLARELATLTKKIVGEVNSLSHEEQRRLLEESHPELLEKKEKKKETGLSPLPDATPGNVVMRFAPGPSGPLHIGHTRAVVLNDEYVRMYRGKLILRMEDTNPTKVDPDAYDMIIEDMEWMGAHPDEVYFQSDRFPLYYDVARELLEKGAAYVCTCENEAWREMKIKKQPCPHRERPVEDQLDDWEKMLGGEYAEGEASLVIKTDLSDPNPALRDFVAMRIVESPHPRTGTRYRVYPLYNFSVAVDDHHMGMTHVLRGKDHLNNTLRQKYIYRYMGWKEPVFIHYGWVSMEGVVLKTSTIKKGIKRGEYTGWDDVRLGTLKAMARRGIRPEAIRRYWVEVGIKPVDIVFSWDTLYAYNREIVDPVARRMFFVASPTKVAVSGVHEPLASKPPRHPDHPEWGKRTLHLNPSLGVFLEEKDVLSFKEGEMIRLKDLANFVVRLEGGDTKDGIKGAPVLEYAGNDLSVLRRGIKIVHWLPVNEGGETARCRVLLPEGGEDSGLVESEAAEVKEGVVQFERYGFVNLLGEEGGIITAAYSHR